MLKTLYLALAVLILGAAAPALAQDTVHVRIVTSAGPVTLALDAKHAPKTVANFMKYVDDGRFVGTEFYRASRRKGDAKHGFVQGGIARDARRILPSVPLEPTSQTGIHHTDGTISMAHGADPDSADGNFSIMVGDNPSLDARGKYRGFAAFGHVIKGMDIVRRILALPTGGGRGEMRGQMIKQPVKIIRVDRLDGTPHPTGGPKPWLINIRRH
ncbi:peptidylprolyl isomerase [Stakelama marina]|uniref:peptidylprolyl isomerase n=1 Tax=Stakelama marina TaxID=2826939 RepID=A0A8T4IFS2_9SPHN|nr:peptidylprolyl isomerase [Stakelama marina]MBR0551096.1 peptidylprolyl isomerase [Stakelama marina]